MVAMPTARASIALALVAAVAGVFVTASCTSGGPDRAAEKRNCETVGRLLGAAPGSEGIWKRQITTAGKTGSEVLDAAMHSLAAGLDRNDATGANAAITRVRTACVSLGLWQAYH